MTQTTINIVAVICMEIGWTDAIRRTWPREGTCQFFACATPSRCDCRAAVVSSLEGPSLTDRGLNELRLCGVDIRAPNALNGVQSR